MSISTRFRLRPLLIGLIALLLIGGLVEWPVVRELRQEAKDRGLIAAVKRLDDRVVIRLLNEGADPNTCDLPQDTRPFWRIYWDIMRKRKRIDTTENLTALETALITVAQVSSRGVTNSPDVRSAQDRVACALLNRGAKVCNTQRESALTEAAIAGADNCILQRMLDRGADINAKWPNDGMTALDGATACGQVSAIRFLLSHHANVAIKDFKRNSVLYFVDNWGYRNWKQIVHLLRQAGAR